ncbi:hypothetical protein BDR04DRAFT_1130096 [Suillus decipiens]|nr:hypothetical protein BDR04DRAFT_1130096 [Suillus decipiens]
MSNLMCTSILPGPKEQNPEQIQQFLHPIISDLLHLWKDGINIPTESCPKGHLVRVILVAVVCDKPAAHKVRGFASHSHTHFCTIYAEQCKLGEEYWNLTTRTACKNFIKEHATRYTQLSHLPYFNLVEQIIIDPMHNLFLASYRQI